MIIRIKAYFREIKLEWSKVSKPKWDDVKANSLVVIVATLIMAVFLGMVDGNPGRPLWVAKESIFGPGLIGMILLVFVILWISRRFTDRWEFSIPIALAPLAIVMILHYFSPDAPVEVKGFGIVWLRQLFIR